MKNLPLAFCIVTLAFASCQNNKVADSATSLDTVEDTTTVVDMHTSQIALDWSGRYEGTLPCADCPGIKTAIELRYDNTFTQHLEYLEKKDGNFNETGKIEWHENGNKITLRSENGEKQEFKIREGSMVMLNQDGEENTGPLAEKYVLEKLD